MIALPSTPEIFLLLIGIIAGVIGVLATKENYGFIVTIIAGIIGSIFGTVFGLQAGNYTGAGMILGQIFSIFGAAVFVYLSILIKKRRS